MAGSSLYQLRSQLEPHVAAALPDPLLVYLPDRQESEGRPVLLELLRAGSSFEIKLVSRARGYLREVLEPQKVDKLLKRPDLTYRDIALALEQSGAGGFSQLKALFQLQLGRNSSPENAELARLWLAADALDDAIRAKGLENELQELLHSRWGLGFPVETTLADWRQRAQRALLLHKLLHDWHGENLTSFARQSLPVGKAAEENALGLDLDQAQAPLPKAAAPVEAWLAYQAEIAHHVDGLQRRLEQQVAELFASEVEIAAGLEQLRGRYEALLRGGWGAGGLEQRQNHTLGPSAAAGTHGGGDLANGSDPQQGGRAGRETGRQRPLGGHQHRHRQRR